MYEISLGLNTVKITDYIKNTSNKSCLKLNFLQKNQQMRRILKDIFHNIFPKIYDP